MGPAKAEFGNRLLTTATGFGVALTPFSPSAFSPSPSSSSCPSPPTLISLLKVTSSKSSKKASVCCCSSSESSSLDSASAREIMEALIWEVMKERSERRVSADLELQEDKKRQDCYC